MIESTTDESVVIAPAHSTACSDPESEFELVDAEEAAGSTDEEESADGYVLLKSESPSPEVRLPSLKLCVRY